VDNLIEFLHEYVMGDQLEIVYITDCKETVIGLKDSKSNQVFIVGAKHDLTFIQKHKKSYDKGKHKDLIDKNNS